MSYQSIGVQMGPLARVDLIPQEDKSPLISISSGGSEGQWWITMSSELASESAAVLADQIAAAWVGFAAELRRLNAAGVSFTVVDDLDDDVTGEVVS